MRIGYETAAGLFREGEFLQLIEAAGSDEKQRAQLEPRCRVLVANALALIGELVEARSLAEQDKTPGLPPTVRSQAETTLGLVNWRMGDVAAALQHATTGIRLAQEANDVERLAWAHLHCLRIRIEVGPVDATLSDLPHVRRAVARAGVAAASAYLHNCVAVLEGQTGRLDESRRHLEIAESLLTITRNAWIAGLIHVHRAAVACQLCEFESASRFLRAAKETTKHSGSSHNELTANTTLGYLDFLSGDFDKARRVLIGVTTHPRASVFLRLSALDTLARIHLATGELAACEAALRHIDEQVRQSPEVSTIFHVRRSVIVRAQLYARTERLDEALEYLAKGTQTANQLGDSPLNAAVQLQVAQIQADSGRHREAIAAVLAAERMEISAIRELQAPFYYGAARILKHVETPLKHHLRERAQRLWTNQRVVAIRAEMDADGPTRSTERIHTAEKSIECIANSFAALNDLAYEPRLLGDEILQVIKAIGCSPNSNLVESRRAVEPLTASANTTTLPLGKHRDKHLTLVCDIPDDPVKAIMLSDVLRIGRAALELERAREEQRNRAALWPAPPVEEQAGALFLAEEMQTLLATVRRIATTTVPVLITGETGTGKEVVARTIHAYSSRTAAIFQPFNCANVPKDMLDSQLFGHRKGSFTGALEHFPGVIRAANGGTLFLDEIGELTLDLQPKLLRFLESNEVHPVGEAQPVKADVRVIAATNADIDSLVTHGRFREDLFYRLNVVHLHIPPLRERRVEIPPLAHHYLQKHAQEYGKERLRLAEETMEYLVLYRWPGNVRQLANEMRRMAVLAESDAVLMPEHLHPEIAASRRTLPASERALEPTELVVRMDQPMLAAVQHLERSMIQRAMRITGGRVEDAAAMLGLSRKGLYLKRSRYGLEPPPTAETLGVV